MNKQAETRFKQYDKLNTNDLGVPLEGEYVINLFSFDGFDKMDCILRFENGRLHGDGAVRAASGYAEKWDNGRFVSALPSICVPDR